MASIHFITTRCLTRYIAIVCQWNATLCVRKLLCNIEWRTPLMILSNVYVFTGIDIEQRCVRMVRFQKAAAYAVGEYDLVRETFGAFEQ